MIYLTPNWRAEMVRSYSTLSLYIGVVLLLLPPLLWSWFGLEVNPYHIGNAALLAFAAGILGKPIDQNRSGRVARALFAAALFFAALVLVLSIGRAVYDNVTLPAPVVTQQGDQQAALVPVMGQVAPEAVAPAPPAVGLPVPDSVFLQVAVPHVGKWEGLRLTAYLDRIARPPVWTVCYGETKGVRAGDTFTKAQCDKMLARELVEYRAGLHRYFTPETKTARLPVARDTAFTSLAYNAGVAGVGKSTAVRRLNGGDIAGACDALTWWNKAGGRVVRGLVNRRADDFALCMKGVAS